uniref:Uncharacterized protein n=1 Tax=Ciona intestinalis TaxID=7719 RepID=F6YCL5_CIOIN
MNKSALLLLLVIGLLVLPETSAGGVWSRRRGLWGRRQYNQESTNVEENDLMINEVMQKLNQQDD